MRVACAAAALVGASLGVAMVGVVVAGARPAARTRVGAARMICGRVGRTTRRTAITGRMTGFLATRAGRCTGVGRKISMGGNEVRFLDSGTLGIGFVKPSRKKRN